MGRGRDASAAVREQLPHHPGNTFGGGRGLALLAAARAAVNEPLPPPPRSPFGRGRGAALLAAVDAFAGVQPPPHPGRITVVRRNTSPTPQERAIVDRTIWDDELL